MIIQRYLLREIALSFLAVSLVLGLMFLSGTFVRLLAETLEGRYPANLLFSLFALRSLGSMVLLLPFALFMAVMITLGRFYRDSEMAVLSACGFGPLQLFRTVALAAVSGAVLVGGLSLWVAPWAETRSAMVVAEAGARVGVEGIMPGQFNTLPGGSVVYVEHIDAASKQLQGVFAVLHSEGQQHQLSAARGREYLEPSSGDRYLLLEDGYRYEGQHGQAAFRIMYFVEHGIRIQERAVAPAAQRRSGSSSLELWRSGGAADQIELQWRLAMPLTTLILALLAVPLSRSSPRQGRLLGLFLGVVVYMAYNNALSIGRSMLNAGDLPLWFGLWWVHLLAAALIAWLLWRQLNMPAPRRSTRRGV
ncbi:MAG: LPS export ABC transporter permease LptF [Chromatiales bacterium]|nr:LPS export ABC transporter permease LptF [Gammaproteobacteria bacterium]MBW6476623.1 LPS export ABC transporter permease LptF [Chromatiales bacterium]